jgi:hypothetical protein
VQTVDEEELESNTSSDLEGEFSCDYFYTEKPSSSSDASNSDSSSLEGDFSVNITPSLEGQTSEDTDRLPANSERRTATRGN